ncbi:MAG: PQQ-binding-like beta-propeller repeat protein [Deltaproteobacteria bacterium]|nr:PQQ-binding-like beta-propeller repeat protein [Deltaproteobacteria bacterium]
MKPAALFLLAACGSSADAPSPVVEPAPTIVEPAPRPEPGVDLAGPIAGTESAPMPRKPAVPFDLAADRAVVKVSVPVPPRGGSVAFTFADERPGWVARIPEAQQLPSVAYGHDRVFVSGGFNSVSFYALDATTGRIEWATTNLEDNGPTAAIVDGEDVLFNTESCTLFSLNAKTGKRNWLRYLGDPTLSQIALVDGLVYSSYPDPEAGGQMLGAFRSKTGAPVWSRSVGAELLATPVISGDSVYVSTIAGMTYRFEHRTGRTRWAKPLRATTAPWIVGDELFVTRRSGAKEQQIVVAVDTGKIVREHRVSAGSYAYDVPSSLESWETVWAFEGSRPVVDRGIHYVAMGNEVIASDAKTGESIWHRRYNTKADARSLGSVALAGSTIVVSSRDGKVFGLDVDTGFTLWSYDIGRKIVAEPIIARGWLYSTTTDGFVIALNVADKSLDGWHMFGGNAAKNGATIAPPTPKPLEGNTTQLDDVSPDALVAKAQPTFETRFKADVEADALDAALARKAAEVRARRSHPVELDPSCLTDVFCRK